MKHGKHLLLYTLFVVWGWQTGHTQCTYSLSETTTAVACAGGANGTINLTVSGNTAPYTYAWSNTANTEDLSNLPLHFLPP
jgi:hypothetical protein